MTRRNRSRLEARGAAVALGGRPILHGVDLAVPDAKFTAVIGPNGSGKSTLLKTFARALPTQSGLITLDDVPVMDIAPKAIARAVGYLPQAPLAPDGITVGALVARGRYPHRKFLSGWQSADEAAVEQALSRTGLHGLADRPVAELSGGQRQRVWIALILAQNTPIMLLDEPTSALDISHELEVLTLCADLAAQGSTIVAVLHDLNYAMRFAEHVVVIHQGRVFSEGAPAMIATPQMLLDVFGVDAAVTPDPESGSPMIIPRVPTPGEKGLSHGHS